MSTVRLPWLLVGQERGTPERMWLLLEQAGLGQERASLPRE